MLENFAMRLPISVQQLIETVKLGKKKAESFYVYAKKDTGQLTADQECYLDDYPTGDIDGEDIFSNFVVSNNLQLIYYGEQFEDVVTNVLHQRPTASIDDFINALNYYMKRDTFLDF